MEREELEKHLKKIEENEIKKMQIREGQYVFISYSSADKDVVWSVFKSLYSKGYNVFIDRAHFSFGDDHRVEEMNYILSRHCKGILLFASEKSLFNNNVKNELEIADGVKKDIRIIEIFKDSNIKSCKEFKSSAIQKYASGDSEFINNWSTFQQTLDLLGNKLNIQLNRQDSTESFLNEIEECINKLGLNTEARSEMQNVQEDNKKVAVNVNIKQSNNNDSEEKSTKIKTNEEIEKILEKRKGEDVKKICEEVVSLLAKIGKDHLMVFNDKSQKPEKSNPHFQLCQKVANLLNEYLIILNIEDEYKASHAVGKGNWGKNPYFLIRNKHISKGGTDGLHIITGPETGDKDGIIYVALNLGEDRIHKDAEKWYKGDENLKLKFKTLKSFKDSMFTSKKYEIDSELREEYLKAGFKKTDETLICKKKISALDVDEFKKALIDIFKIYMKYAEIHKNNKFNTIDNAGVSVDNE